MNTNVTLVQAADLLRRANPAAWDAFLRGVNEQLDKVATALVNAPPDTVLVHQGRVQSMSALVADLSQAREIAEKIANSQARRK